MNPIVTTLVGWVATDPRYVVGPTGTRLTSFRLATTSRYFNRDKNAFEDGKTEWFTIRTHRQTAVNVKASIEKGQPVIVTGTFKTHEWDGDNGARVDLIIDATAVGHDLAKGIATFSRATLNVDTTSDDEATADEATADEATAEEIADTVRSVLATN